MGNADKLVFLAKKREQGETKKRAAAEEARKQVGPPPNLPPTPEIVVKEVVKPTAKSKQSVPEEQDHSRGLPSESQASAGPVTIDESRKRITTTSDEGNSNKRARGEVPTLLDKGMRDFSGNSEETPKKGASELPSCFQVKDLDKDLQEYYFPAVDAAFLRDLPYEEVQEMLLQEATWGARIVSTLLWYRQLEAIKTEVLKHTQAERAELHMRLSKANTEMEMLKEALSDEKDKVNKLDKIVKDYEDKFKRCAKLQQNMNGLEETVKKLTREMGSLLVDRDTIRKENEVILERNPTLSADVGDAQVQLLNPGDDGRMVPLDPQSRPVGIQAGLDGGFVQKEDVNASVNQVPEPSSQPNSDVGAKVDETEIC